MSSSEADGWVCPQCGTTNYYHPTRCTSCPYGRRTSANLHFDTRRRSERKPARRSVELPEAVHRKRIVFLGIPLLAFLSWLYLIWEYHKWDAAWGRVHVLIPSILAAAVCGWWISRRSWYREGGETTRWRFILLPLIGFLLCAALGIYFTEPLEPGGTTTLSGKSANSGSHAYASDRRSPEYRYDYSRSRAADWYIVSRFLDFGGGAADIAGDTDLDEGCLFLLLVLLVVALVLGSVFVPHFWTLATFVLLVIMTMVALREWRFAEKS